MPEQQTVLNRIFIQSHLNLENYNYETFLHPNNANENLDHHRGSKSAFFKVLSYCLMGNTEANGNIMYVYQSNRTCDMKAEVKMKSKESSQTWTLGEL